MGKRPQHSIWFHYDNKPSCHVYAYNKDLDIKKLTKSELKQGALLVRKYSKSNDKVCYTSKKNIKCFFDGSV